MIAAVSHAAQSGLLAGHQRCHGADFARRAAQPILRSHRASAPLRQSGKSLTVRAGELVLDRRALQTMAASRIKAELALEDLLQGNKRFQQGALKNCVVDATRFEQLSAGQAPPAIVLSCSDSRVPPEMVMDQGMGDLFVIRVAGNVLDDNVIGTMLYAIANLGSRAVLILGHSKCGACTAAKGAFISAKSGQGDVASAGDPVSKLLSRLMDPCAKLAGRSGNGSQDLESSLGVEGIVEENARHVAELTLQSLQENLTGNGNLVEELVIAAGKYDLDHGTVSVLEKRWVENGKIQQQ